MNSMNGVIIFDEIDKISSESILYSLLSIIDPVQSSIYEDKYLNGLKIDLSNYIYIFTLNEITKLPKPLQDRIGCNLISLEDYTHEEKIKIFSDYDIAEGDIIITDDIYEMILESFDEESTGLRGFEGNIKRLVRGIKYRMFIDPEKYKSPFKITKDHVKLILY